MDNSKMSDSSEFYEMDNSDDEYYDANSHATTNEAYNADTASDGAAHVDYRQDGDQGKQGAICQKVDQEKKGDQRQDGKLGLKVMKGTTDVSQGVQPEQGSHGNTRPSEENEATGGHEPVISIESKVSDEQKDSQTKKEDPHTFLGDETTLLVIGHTGHGMSSLANKLIGKQCFLTASSPKSTTTEIQRGSFVHNGENITLIDTPGINNNVVTPDKIKTEISKGLAASPRAFIYVLKHGRTTEQVTKSLLQIKEMLGPALLKYVIIVITSKDQIEEDCTYAEYVNSLPKCFKSFFRKCDDRVIFVNCKESGNNQVKSELFSQLDSINKKTIKHKFCTKLKSVCVAVFNLKPLLVKPEMLLLCTFGVFVLIPYFYIVL